MQCRIQEVLPAPTVSSKKKRKKDQVTVQVEMKLQSQHHDEAKGILQLL